MKLVVGLGNPGSRYETTRHNVGFMAADLIGDEMDVSISQKFGKSLVAEAHYAGEKVVLAKPQCYMNRSGLAVKEIASYFNIEAEDMIIIHDDLDIDFGRLRVRTKGGHGGHRGIISVMETVGSEGFVRVKIGIGRAPGEMDPAEYVLSAFDAGEWDIMKETLQRACDAVLCLLTEDAETAMNRYNCGVLSDS